LTRTSSSHHPTIHHPSAVSSFLPPPPLIPALPHSSFTNSDHKVVALALEPIRLSNPPLPAFQPRRFYIGPSSATLTVRTLRQRTSLDSHLCTARTDCGSLMDLQLLVTTRAVTAPWTLVSVSPEASV
jgi:hypothetical protein